LESDGKEIRNGTSGGGGGGGIISSTSSSRSKQRPDTHHGPHVGFYCANKRCVVHLEAGALIHIRADTMAVGFLIIWWWQ